MSEWAAQEDDVTYTVPKDHMKGARPLDANGAHLTVNFLGGALEKKKSAAVRMAACNPHTSAETSASKSSNLRFPPLAATDVVARPGPEEAEAWPAPFEDEVPATFKILVSLRVNGEESVMGLFREPYQAHKA